MADCGCRITTSEGEYGRFECEIDLSACKYIETAAELERVKGDLRKSKLELRCSQVVEADKDALIETLVEGLTEIRDEKSRWMENVGSYSGGETYAAFAARLQEKARSALQQYEQQRHGTTVQFRDAGPAQPKEGV